MKSFRSVAAAVALALGTAAPAHATILYDAGLGTRVDQQGWLYLTDPLLGAQAQRSFTGGVTRLDSTPSIGESAGFFSRLDPLGFVHPNMPALDRQTGYTMHFRVGVPVENHSSSHRAGFSVLVVGDDLRSVELGFWTDEIWVQSGPSHLDATELLFTHAEGSSTLSATLLTDYELRVLGDSYSLWSGQAQLLAGPLRDYSSHVHPVYSQANTIFLGDNTGSASAVAEIGYVAVLVGVVPEPNTPMLLLAALVAGCTLRRRRTA